MLVWVIAVVLLRMSVAAHVGRRTVMLFPGILRVALSLGILKMLKCAVIRMTFFVSVMILMIPVMMMLVLVVIPIAIPVMMFPVTVIPVVVMPLIPVRSVMPPIRMVIPIGMLTTPMAVALFWVAIAVTEIRVIFRMIVTVVVTLGMA